MTTNNYTSSVNNVPLAKQLNVIFRAMPDKQLIKGCLLTHNLQYNLS